MENICISDKNRFTQLFAASLQGLLANPQILKSTYEMNNVNLIDKIIHKAYNVAMKSYTAVESNKNIALESDPPPRQVTPTEDY